MDAKALNSNLCAIIVNNPGKSLAVEMALLLNRLDIEYVSCGDVYDVVGKLAAGGLKNRVVLVIGRLEELCGEGNNFFEICDRCADVIYCCVVCDGLNHGAKKISAAARAGAFLVCDIKEFREALEKIQSNAAKGFTAGKIKSDESTLSGAELDALLGEEVNAD